MKNEVSRLRATELTTWIRIEPKMVQAGTKMDHLRSRTARGRLENGSPLIKNGSGLEQKRITFDQKRLGVGPKTPQNLPLLGTLTRRSRKSLTFFLSAIQNGRFGGASAAPRTQISMALSRQRCTSNSHKIQISTGGRQSASDFQDARLAVLTTRRFSRRKSGISTVGRQSVFFHSEI